jgi:hypothetical protein
MWVRAGKSKPLLLLCNRGRMSVHLHLVRGSLDARVHSKSNYLKVAGFLFNSHFFPRSLLPLNVLFTFILIKAKLCHEWEQGKGEGDVCLCLCLMSTRRKANCCQPVSVSLSCRCDLKRGCLERSRVDSIFWSQAGSFSLPFLAGAKMTMIVGQLQSARVTQNNDDRRGNEKWACLY